MVHLSLAVPGGAFCCTPARASRRPKPTARPLPNTASTVRASTILHRPGLQWSIHFVPSPGELMDIIDAATRGDLVVVLAIGLVALAGAVGFLFRTVLKVYQERVKRSEDLNDRMLETFDALEKATTTAVAVARDSLDELRRR